METRLRPFGMLFERSLKNLIKGLRARTDSERLAKYIKQVIAECREEVRSANLDIKAMAVLKLSYLEMYGFDMSWAGFHVLEVMSSSKFQQKRVGYLAAMQSIHSDPELLVLITNLLKNDLAAPTQERVAIALSGLASVVSPLLASDICDDISKMLSHSNAYVRKRAVLAMYKLILQYPEALDAMLSRFRDKLDDDDVSVVSATVNVVCELSHQSENLSRYMQFAPPMYEILTTKKNTWMSIKILKLLSRFALFEPRLKAKFRPHLVSIIESETAESLLYEAISAILKGQMIDEADFQIAKLLIQKLRKLISGNDPNLKYVSLSALSQMAKINPEFLAGEHGLVLDFGEDSDVSLRRKVLEIMNLVVTEDTLVDTVMRLMDQLRTPDMLTYTVDYQRVLVTTIVHLCSHNNYDRLPNFEWYIQTLVELANLTYAEVKEVGHLVGSQLQNVALRVKSVRHMVVPACLQLSQNKTLTVKHPDIMFYTLWVAGEYIESSMMNDARELIANLSESSASAILLPALAKIFSQWIKDIEGQKSWSRSRSAVEHTISNLLGLMQSLVSSSDLEVQERAVQFSEIFKLAADAIVAHPKESEDVPPFLIHAFYQLKSDMAINPVAKETQAYVSIPDGLDLDEAVPFASETWLLNQDDSEFDVPEVVTDGDLRASLSESNGIESAHSEMNVLNDVFTLNNDKSNASAQIEATKVKAQFGRVKVPKVKVDIAQDEDLGNRQGVQSSSKMPASSSHLFNAGNRLKDQQNLATAEDAPVEVVVKHKKVNKGSSSTREKRSKKERKTKPKARDTQIEV